MSEETTPMPDTTSAPTAPDPQDPLTVPMDHVITTGSKTEGHPTQKTADPSESLPDDPEEQNDLA